MRTCKKCGETKPFEEFAKNNRSKDGRRHHCKPCVAAYQRAYYRTESGSKALHSTMVKTKFGISADEYDALLDSQNGLCAICEQVCVSGRRLAVDHCHETGRVRGLLCGKCNRGIGLLGDDPHRLHRVVEYLTGRL